MLEGKELNRKWRLRKENRKSNEERKKNKNMGKTNECYIKKTGKERKEKWMKRKTNNERKWNKLFERNEFNKSHVSKIEEIGK